MSDIQAVAAALDEAVSTATATPQFDGDQSLTLDEAYAVQRAGIALRQERGDEVVGVKLGFTSKAKAEQMGVTDVIIGEITESMRVETGGSVDLGSRIHPRIEPEVAFRLGSAIDPHGDDDPVDAVVEIAAALEIIDSRYEDFKFSLADVVADNTSASGFVIGPWLPFAEAREDLDFAALDVTLTINGETVATGSSADILGDPVLALGAVKRMAARHGLALPAGSIILAGAATAASALAEGAVVTAKVDGLGTIEVTAGDAHA